MTELIRGNLYDFPRYYDLLFGSDWKAEYDFLLACFERYAGCRVNRLFEPACGTGRLLYRFGRNGYEVAGNDLNPLAVEYANRRLQRCGLPQTVSVGDMADFTVRKKFHAAFNTISSFRHLDSEQAAEDHLHCVANALVKGGIYVLGLHLTPTVGEPIESEEWTARRGHLQVNSVMWRKELDLRKRNERLGMTFDIYTPRKHLRIEDEMNYRTYTAAQFDRLLSRCPEWEIAALHDFVYEIDEPIEIEPTTEDVVFVLRKR